MRQIRIDQNDYCFLSSWEEVGADLLLTILPHIYTEDRDTAKAALVPLLSNIPGSVLIQLTTEQYTQLFDLTDWLWTDPLTIPIIPQIEHRDLTWQMPDECLYDSPFIEYDHLDSFFQADEPDIPKIIATLLRPLGSDGKRIPFDGMQLDALAEQLADLQDHFQAYCLLFATGCLRYIRAEYAGLWEEDGNAPDPSYQLQPAEGLDFSWTGAAFRIAEEGFSGRTGR